MLNINRAKIFQRAFNIKLVTKKYTVWFVNDGAGRDLPETFRKPPGKTPLPVSIKMTKSGVFPDLNDVGLEISNI